MGEQFTSKALEANLAETRYRDIYIPEEHQHFIQLSNGYFGLKKRANDCITEYHHPLSNRKFVVEELREMLITDMWFYTREGMPAEALKIPLGMLGKLLSEKLNVNLTTTIIRTLLEFVSLIVKSKPGHHCLVPFALEILDNQIENNSFSFLLSTKYFARYLDRAADDPQFGVQSRELSAKVFEACYRFWEQSSRIADWTKKNQQIPSDELHLLNNQLGEPFFESLFANLAKQKEESGFPSQMVVYEDIAERFAATADVLSQFIHKFQFVFYLLHLKGMEIITERLIWSLEKLIRQTVDELNEADLTDFINLIFNLAEEMRTSHTSAVLDFLQTLGLKVIDIDKTPQKELVNHFEKKIISFGFISPGTVFVDEDWQLSVNTNHIKNIRVWLQLIESSQSGMEKLLSALIVNLRLGGIFISDTDLFQREITKVLNSNIGPYYKKVKQLTRIFPVYFNEIGAEGELRDVSTKIDELSHRNDKLIHFLRKQIHTEGNNSHIQIILQIIGFWYDLNINRLRPILPQNVLSTIDVESVWVKGVHEVLQKLCTLASCSLDDLLHKEKEELEELSNNIDHQTSLDKER
ncbi:MAG TPA: hypothetical protein PK939_04195, partial [Bacteroidales bacterium]|nr:hypothetical protein [Bacteroidales bacterium]